MSVRFIAPDDYLIVMIDQAGGQFTQDDLYRLRDAGVKTVTRYVIWRDIEDRPYHQNWKPVDDWLRMDRRAGLKTLLGVYDLAPAHYPDDWYMCDLNGERYQGSFYANLLAPWHEAAWCCHLDFIDACCRLCNSSDVLCFRSTMHGGEVMFPDYQPVLFPAGFNLKAECARIFLEEQKLFYGHPAHELFTAFHHAFDPLPFTGNQYAQDLYDIIRTTFTDARHYGICYTRYAPVGGLGAHDLEARQFPVFCGSEYCEGLVHNTAAAISQGFRGFFTAPLHAMTDHRQLEPWMLDAIRAAISQWEEAGRVRGA